MSDKFEKRISEGTNPYKLIADKIHDVVFVLDGVSLEYLYISPSVKEFRGYEPSEIINRSVQEVLTPESFKVAMENYKILLDEYRRGLGPKRTVQLEMYTKDGGTVWGEVTACFTRDHDSQLLLLGVTREITERKRMEDINKRLIDELHTALKEQKRLATENRVLRGLLPICAECNKIRDENGIWHDFELFIQERSEATFTHTICPPCQQRLYPELSR